MAWDPRSEGSLCDSCPLAEDRGGDPVPARWPDNPRALIVGEVPGAVEVKRGEPFVGRAGQELQAALASIGIPRSAVAITNVLPCMPPGEATGALDRYLKEIKKRDPPVNDPRDCCRPRLLRELARCPNIIPVGGTALHAVCGGSAGILNARGSPIQVPGHVEIGSDGEELAIPTLRVLPTLHPSFVMRSRRWRGAFRADLARAFRWFSTGLEWQDPVGWFAPTPAELEKALAWFRKQPFSAFDVETSPGFPAQDHFDPLHDRLRCLGIGTADRFVVVPFRSVDRERPPFYQGQDAIKIVDLLRNYLTDPGFRKVSWNGRAYDRTVLESQLGVVPQGHLDAIGLHRLAEPELPHDLGYSGSIYTDVDDWKAGHVATQARTDQELHFYCAKDLAVTALTVGPLKAACEKRSQLHLLPFFARLQDVCVELHRNGMLVDQAARREWDRKLAALASASRRKLRELTGKGGLNPGSVPQIRDLLFETLKIIPHGYTDSGDPSTNDDALRAFLSSGWGLDDHARAIVNELRAFRRQTKRRGAVIRLRPITEEYYEDPDLAYFEETEEEREERLDRIKRGKSGRACGLVLPDGRVHSNYLAHGTCVDPRTWTLTGEGPRRFGGIKELRLIHDGDELRVATRKVFVSPTEGRHMVLALGFELIGANGHRVQVAPDTSNRRYQFHSSEIGPREPEPIWKSLDEITASDYVRIRIGMNAWAKQPPKLNIPTPPPRRTNSNEILLPDRVTEDLAYFAGCYNADGCFQDGNGSFAILIVCRVRVERRPFIRAAMERLFGVAAVHEDKDGIRVTSVALQEWVEAVELRRLWKNKRAPSWVFAAPRRFVEAYLRGLALDASIHVHGDNTRWRYSGNAALTDEVHVLLSNMGIVASRTQVDEAQFEVRATGKDAEEICQITGKEYVAHLWQEGEQTRPKFIRRGNTLWLRVAKIESIKPQAFLDLTIPATSRYWANGTISHNTGWRLSSNTPNLQNWESKLRNMFVAGPGNVLVACDEAQLELRMVAGLSGCAYYLERFADPKIDPHHDLCVDVLGEPYLQASKEGRKILRVCVKGLTYGGLYGAEDETKLEIIAAAEDPETEKLLFPDFSLREVQAFSRAWHKRCPEIAKWWEATLAEWQKQGFLAEPIMGLRCDFLDGEDPNKLYNYKAQAGGAALCHLALFRAMERLPREAPSARLVQQGHDSIVFECKIEEGQTVAKILEESMREDGNKYGLPIMFVGESKQGRMWKEV